MKILVIGPYGIGNTILSLPMFQVLRKRYPYSQIDILALLNSTYQLLNAFDEFKIFDNIFSLRKKTIIWQLRKAKYDYSIVAFPSAKPHYNVVSYLIHAKERIGTLYPDKNRSRAYFLNNINIPVIEGIHDVYQNINMLSPFGIEYQDIKIKVNQSEQALKKKKKIIGFHPGCKKAGYFKRWDQHYFVELIKIIKHQYKGYRIKLFFGPDEQEDINYFVNNLSGIKFELITNKSIKEVISAINECKLFISNDSGLMHLAVFLGTFSISICGPSDVRRTGPFGHNKKIIHSDISCRPCSHSYSIASHKFKCIHDTRICLEVIKPKDVIKQVKRVLSKL